MNKSHALWLALVAAVPVAAAVDSSGPPDCPGAPAIARFAPPHTPPVPNVPRVPLRFIENLGQWHGPARFVARRPGLALSVCPEELVLSLIRDDGERRGRATVRMVFESASADGRIDGEQALGSTTSFFMGNDPARWATGVPSFASVLYRDLLPGVDLRVRDHDGWPEYDVLLEPGVDPSTFEVRCEGVERLEIAGDGALVLHTAEGPLRQSPPVSWQILPSGERSAIDCRYRLLGEGRFGFAAGDLNPGLGLVIDPGLQWASYFGGSADDGACEVVLTPSGAPVVVGMTVSPDLPPPSGQAPIQPSLSGAEDAYVALFDPSGVSLLEMTYLGGAAADGAYDVAIDPAGRVVLAGFTRSANFPTTAGAYDTSLDGLIDGFVSVLDFTLAGPARLAWSTMIGGSSLDWVGAIRVDGSGVATIAGFTHAADFPVTPGAFDPAANGGRDVFVARLDPSLIGPAQLIWSTYFGGSGHEGVQGAQFPSLPAPPQTQAGYVDLALDSANRVTLTGSTASTNLPLTPGAFRASYIGPAAEGDGFVARFDPSQSGAAQLLWSTYFGGFGAESGLSVALAPAGRVAVGGYTYAADFPLTSNAFDASFGGEWDGFLLVFDPAQSGAGQLAYGSYLGGSARDGVFCVRPAGTEVFVVVGTTGSPDLPTTPNAFDPTHNGLEDGFVTVLDIGRSGAAQLVYSTFLGGSLLDFAVAGELHSDGSLVVVGWTRSADFPATPSAFMSLPGGGYDALLASFDLGLGGDPPMIYCTAKVNSQGCLPAITWAGSPSATAGSGFLVSAANVLNNKHGVLFYGTNGRAAIPFQGGTLCMNPPLIRTTLQHSGGNPPPDDCSGQFQFDFNALIASGANPSLVAGQTVDGQYWSRDSQASFGTNLTDAVEFTIGP